MLRYLLADGSKTNVSKCTSTGPLFGQCLSSCHGGKENPSASYIKKILESVGIGTNETCMGKVVSEPSG
ncbi:hypothetical protein NFI96_004374 [Prochilodus magdalenae]|nr:hypothetical protein NFI96_004374 [Prochilodus magdalenae]